ncbi:uncharacterized protein LOC115080167 [Rhinatrema bivittatum]|uniref:uncharacterized protein LOC115080167 n=1 Tax=Rhinatrema bivittatum TaxID=194408 RepID=UPI00112DB50E|nr:uncharacterized protein LOC115080167 [Rhinatrema bivittatum]
MADWIPDNVNLFHQTLNYLQVQSDHHWNVFNQQIHVMENVSALFNWTQIRLQIIYLTQQIQNVQTQLYIGHTPIWKTLFEHYVKTLIPYPLGWRPHPEQTTCSHLYCTGLIEWCHGSNTTTCKFMALPFHVWSPSGPVLVQLTFSGKWIFPDNRTFSLDNCIPLLSGHLACHFSVSRTKEDCTLQHSTSECALWILPADAQGFTVVAPQVICVYNFSFSGCIYNISVFSFSNVTYYLPAKDTLNISTTVNISIAFLQILLLDLWPLQRAINTSHQLQQILTRLNKSMDIVSLRTLFVADQLHSLTQKIAEPTTSGGTSLQVIPPQPRER